MIILICLHRGEAYGLWRLRRTHILELPNKWFLDRETKGVSLLKQRKNNEIVHPRTSPPTALQALFMLFVCYSTFCPEPLDPAHISSAAARTYWTFGAASFFCRHRRRRGMNIHGVTLLCFCSFRLGVWVEGYSYICSAYFAHLHLVLIFKNASGDF